MKQLVLVVLFVALAACSKKKADGTQGAASGSAPVAGSAGSGSTAGEGPGSATGSGSAAAGSGDGSGSGSAAGSAAGSGDGSGSAAGSAAGSGGGSAASAEESKFDKLSGEEKADFMKKHVVPPMKKAFQKVDAKKFANFGCKTCHGKDPKKAKYKMPNPELPKLDFAKLKAGEDKEVAEFMAKVVKPGMAKILEEKELDPEHPELGGFGCLDCHEQKK